MCFRPHESATVFPSQMPSTLSPFCPPKTADTPSHYSTPHKKAPVSPPHSGWNNQTDLFWHFFSAPLLQYKPNQIAPTAADLIHSDLTENPVRPATPPSAGSTVQSLWFDLRPPLEFPGLLELRFCRFHHQDPGSTSSAHVRGDSAQRSVMWKKGLKSTHSSSIHSGIFSSVALNIHK